MPLLKCVMPSKSNYIMREIHKGICGNHAEGAIIGVYDTKTRLLLAKDESGLYGVHQEM